MRTTPAYQTQTPSTTSTVFTTKFSNPRLDLYGHYFCAVKLRKSTDKVATVWQMHRKYMICYVTWAPLIRLIFVAGTKLLCSMLSFKSPLSPRPLSRPLVDSRNIDVYLAGMCNLHLHPQRPYPAHSPVHSSAKLWREKPKTRAATATPHRTVNKQTSRQHVQ